MKKFFVRLLILAVVFFSFYACRHFFIGTALEFALKRATGNTAAYNNRYWEDGRLFYEGFSLGEQLYAEEAAFDFDFHLFPFSIDAAVHLNTPTVQLGEGQTNLAFLLPAKYWTIKLDIEKGSLLTEEKKLCLFEFASGLEKEEIGKLSIFQEDGAPLFVCGFNYSAESLAIDFQMDEAPLDKTLPLASLFYPLPTWKVLEGSASADLKGNLDMEQLSFLQGKFSLQDVRLESEDLIFAADQAASTIDYQGEIDTLALDSDFKGVDLFWKELEVLRGEGSIVFKPQTTPTFEVHAAVHVADLEGRADLIGKGEIRDNHEWLEGKGEILHHSLWLEGTLDYVTANNPLRVEFSLADDVLQAEIHNLGKEILSLLDPKIKQGSLDGKATAHLEQGIFHRLQLDDIVIHELVYDNFSIPETKLQGSVNLISGDIEQLNLQAHDAAGDVQGWKIASTELAIAIEDNQFKPSSAFGKVEGVPFALEFQGELQGPLSLFHAHAKLIAGASEWMKLPKNLEEPPIILDLTFDRKSEELQIVGTLACLEDTVQLSAQANLSTAALKGVFQTPRVQSSFYQPFLKILAPALAMQGELSLRGQFSEKTIDILAQGEDLIVKSPDFQLSVLGQSREILYHYDFVAKQGNGKGNLSPILFTTPQFSQAVSITGGELSFDETSLSCQALIGQISGIDVEGNLTANWEEELQASFSSQKIQGSLENLIPSYDLRGCFTLEKVQAHYADGKINYRFNSLLEEVEGALTPQLQIQKTSCSLEYDSLENQLIVQKLKGTLFEDLTFSAQEIRYQNGQWNFEGAFNQNEQTILSLQGKALATPLGYQVTLQEAKASKSYLKSPLSFHWTPSSIDQVHGEVFIDTANLFEQLHLLDRLGLPLSSGVKEALEQLQGTLTLKLIIDADRSEYEVEGSQIRYASTLFGAVSAHLIQQGTQWSLKQCSLDDIKIKGEAAFQNAKWVVSSCTIDWKDLKLYTSGIYEKERFDFKAEGQLSRFSLTGNGTFLSATPQFQNLFFKVEQLATLSCDKIVYKNGKWESPALDLTILSPELSVPLRTKLQLSLSPQSTTFQGTVSQGEINIGKAALKITQISGLYEASYLNLKCLGTLGKEPLHFLAKFNERFAGGVNIQSGKDVLKLALSDLKTCQKAEGELFGINVNLQREGQGFKGTVILKDPSKLAELMGTENLKDYFGLQLTGLFTKETFKGELEGRDARIKDYLVQEIHATVDYAPTRFKLKNLTLQDPAGSFTVKECNGFRTSASESWNVTIPILKGQEIKPSAIRKLGASQKEIKPLQIRYFVMTDILGQLGDLSSFRGQGKFNFTQRVKKEPSLFDIPLALLKDFGLDLDLFSPVMGEVQLQLKTGKLFFTNLQNAFSEGKRSEFYLAEQPSYIDLNGGLFLNLRMQQNVVLKLVEPFMIAVRGTWEKPKYSLQ